MTSPKTDDTQQHSEQVDWTGLPSDWKKTLFPVGGHRDRWCAGWPPGAPLCRSQADITVHCAPMCRHRVRQRFSRRPAGGASGGAERGRRGDAGHRPGNRVRDGRAGGRVGGRMNRRRTNF